LQHCRCIQLHQCVTALSLSPRLRELHNSTSKAQLFVERPARRRRR
jgi:hypothetical protein